MSDSRTQRLAMADFDYDLPEELIAQVPLLDRSASRLMTVDGATGVIAHRAFTDLPELLKPGDLLVMNDSRVIPARLHGHRSTGASVEFLLLRREDDGTWQCLMRPAARLKDGERVEIVGKAGTDYHGAVTVVEHLGEGRGRVALDQQLAEHLGDFGTVPLPPYIHERLDDDERYQTVYARLEGSAAAPTAGLHFTPEVLQSLADRGVNTAWVTLHVGLDTFRPVTAEYAEDHVIHQEWCSVPQGTADAIGRTRAAGGRVVAVGTTAARTLESYAASPAFASGSPFEGMTRIYITPGYAWALVDAMVTNFHLPKSSLLLMMSSFAGKDLLFDAYGQAIAARYRFFSFGDAMFIVRKAHTDQES